MASTFKSVQVTDGLRRYNEKGVYCLYGTYELAAALVVNDVIQMVNVPNGAVVLAVGLFCDDLDDGTQLVLDVGDGSSTARFISATTIGQAGGQIFSFSATYGVATGFAYQYDAEDTIDVKVNTAPQSGTSTGTITLIALVCNDLGTI